MKKTLVLALSLLLFYTPTFAQPIWILTPNNGSWQTGSRMSARGWTQNFADGSGNVLVYGALSPCGDPFSNTIWSYNVALNTSSILWTSGGGRWLNGSCIAPKTIEGDGTGVMGDRHPEEGTQYDMLRHQLNQTGGITDLTKYVDNQSFDVASRTVTRLPDNPSFMGPAREEGCSAYDQNADLFVYFAGEVNGGADNKTFIRYPTGNWMQVATTTPPSARIRCRMVYSAELHQVVVLSGTTNGSTWFGDFQTFNPFTLTWTKLTPSGATLPLNTRWLTLADDPALGVMFIYVGTNQLYAFDPVANTLTLTSNAGGPAAPPPTTSNAMYMAFEAVTNKLVLFYNTVNDGNQNIYTLADPSAQ